MPHRALLWLTGLLAGGLLLVACGGGDGDADEGDIASGSASLEDCLAEDGYPCRRDQVDPDVLELEGEYADRLAELILEGTREDAFAWIEAQDRVVESDLGETTLMFRVDGGMPVVFVDPLGAEETARNARASSTNDGLGLSSHDNLLAEGFVSLRRPVAPDGEAVFSPPGGVVGEGTEREDPQNRKKALILTPYEWQGLSMFQTPAAASPTEILRSIPDYSQSPSDVLHLTDEQVTPRSFETWDLYDAIFLETHGGQWIPGGTWIATGVKQNMGGDPPLRFQAICDGLLEPYSDMDGIHCGTLTNKATGEQYVNLGALPRFFRETYGARGGLDKAILYIGGCLTLDNTDVAAVLAGTSSAYLGWTGTVYFPKESDTAASLLWLLARSANGGQKTVEGALETLCNVNGCGGAGFSPSGNTFLEVYDNGDEPKKLRLYDPPTLRDPRSPASGGPGLQDGAELRIKGTPGDGENDKLDVVVDVTGVIDPSDTSGGDLNVMQIGGSTGLRDVPPPSGARSKIPQQIGVARARDPTELYNLRFLIGDEEEEIGADNLGQVLNPTATVAKLNDTTFRYSFTADLPFDVDPKGTETSLKVVVDLPEGGISDYEVDVTLMGSIEVCELLMPNEVAAVLEGAADPVPSDQPPGLKQCHWEANLNELFLAVFSGPEDEADFIYDNGYVGYQEQEIDGIGDRAKLVEHIGHVDGPLWDELRVRIGEYYVALNIDKVDETLLKINTNQDLIDLMRIVLDRLAPTGS